MNTIFGYTPSTDPVKNAIMSVDTKNRITLVINGQDREFYPSCDSKGQWVLSTSEGEFYGKPSRSLTALKTSLLTAYYSGEITDARIVVRENLELRTTSSFPALSGNEIER